MKRRTIGWLAGVVLFAAGAVAFFYLSQQDLTTPPLQPLQPVETPPPPTAQVEEPAIRYPIQQNEAEQAASKPLPSLEESDQTIWDTLYGLLGQQLLNKFYPEGIVRRIVATIDNLPRETVAPRLLPVKPVNGSFLTSGNGQGVSIASENAARYRPYARIAEVVDTQKLVAAYVHFYPLFQRAYQDLGYPKGYFNDRLIAVIDHLLAAPEVKGPVMLVQPHVLYRYADPQLEAASAGHKILIRMGNENAAKVKAKLREIRSELTNLTSQQ